MCLSIPADAQSYPLPHLHDLRHLDLMDRAVEAVLARDREAMALRAVPDGSRGEPARAANDRGVVDDRVAEAPAHRGAPGDRHERRIEREVLDDNARVAVRLREHARRPADHPGLAGAAPLSEH